MNLKKMVIGSLIEEEDNIERCQPDGPDGEQ